MSDLPSLERRALSALDACGDDAALRAWHTQYFGKHGEVLTAVKKISEIPPAERRAYGQEANRVKEALTQAYEQRHASLKAKLLEASLQSDALDVTLPGRTVPRGRLHVATRVLREIRAVFADLGFQVYRSREVEDDL